MCHSANLKVSKRLSFGNKIMRTDVNSAYTYMEVFMYTYVHIIYVYIYSTLCTNIHNIFDAVRHYLPSTFTNTKCTYIHIYMTVYATNRSQNIGTYYNIPFPTLPHSMRLSRHI